MNALLLGPYTTGDEACFAYHIFMNKIHKANLVIPSELNLTEEKKKEIEGNIDKLIEKEKRTKWN